MFQKLKDCKTKNANERMIRYICNIAKSKICKYFHKESSTYLGDTPKKQTRQKIKK